MSTSPSTGVVTETIKGCVEVGVDPGGSEAHVPPAAIDNPDGMHMEIGTAKSAMVPPVVPGVNRAAAMGVSESVAAGAESPCALDATTESV